MRFSTSAAVVVAGIDPADRPTERTEPLTLNRPAQAQGLTNVMRPGGELLSSHPGNTYPRNSLSCITDIAKEERTHKGTQGPQPRRGHSYTDVYGLSGNLPLKDSMNGFAHGFPRSM